MSPLAEPRPHPTALLLLRCEVLLRFPRLRCCASRGVSRDVSRDGSARPGGNSGEISDHRYGAVERAADQARHAEHLVAAKIIIFKGRIFIFY